MSENETIDQFWGKYRFLSNFYPSKIVDIGGLTFPTVEHAYQANKTNKQDDWVYISQLETPGDAKRAGQKVQIMSIWPAIKVKIMYNLLRKKFAIAQLRHKLLATGDAELIEGNSWGDRYWGVCEGKGLNNLGKILMQVRDEVKNRGTICVGKVPNSTHYCGRSTSYKTGYGKDLSVLGNPYDMKNESQRAEVCDKYIDFFYESLYNIRKFKNAVDVIIKDIRNGQDVILGCFCNPKRCHCETIKGYIEGILNTGGSANLISARKRPEPPKEESIDNLFE